MKDAGPAVKQQRSLLWPALGSWCAHLHLLPELLVGELLTPFQTLFFWLKAPPSQQIYGSAASKVCSGRNSFCYSSTCRVRLDLKPLKHCISPAHVQSYSWKHGVCAYCFSAWISQSSENCGWVLSWNGLSVTWFSNVPSARSGAREVSERFWAFIALEMELKYGCMNFASCSCACKTLVLFLRMQDKKRIHFESPRKKSIKMLKGRH